MRKTETERKHSIYLYISLFIDTLETIISDGRRFTTIWYDWSRWRFRFSDLFVIYGDVWVFVPVCVSFSIFESFIIGLSVWLSQQSLVFVHLNSLVQSVCTIRNLAHNRKTKCVAKCVDVVNNWDHAQSVMAFYFSSTTSLFLQNIQ